MRWEFAPEIIPVEAVQVVEDEKGNPVRRLVWFDRDEGVRPSITMEALAKLPTVFKKNSTVTPGNASQMSDGAAFMVLMEKERAFSGGLCVDAADLFFAIRSYEGVRLLFQDAAALLCWAAGRSCENAAGSDEWRDRRFRQKPNP